MMDNIAQTYHDENVRTFPLGTDGKTVQYPAYFCHMMNLVDKRTHKDCECEWYPPFGFVIEAGCPEHDCLTQ